MSFKMADLNDSLFNFWVISNSLNRFSDFDLLRFWDGNIFFPFKNTLALSDHLLIHSLIIAPFYYLGFPLQVLYNLSIFIFFSFNYTSFFYCARKWGCHFFPSMYGSLLFTLNVFTLFHLQHYQFSLTSWIPLLFLSYVLLFNKGHLIYFYCFGLSFLGIALSSPYMLVFSFPFVTVLLSSLLIHFIMVKHLRKTDLFKCVCYILSILLIIGIFYYPYYQSQVYYNLIRTEAEQISLSLKWNMLLDYSGLLLPMNIFGDKTKDHKEVFYIGFSMILSIIISISYLFFIIIHKKPLNDLHIVILIILMLILYLFAAQGPKPENTLFGLNVFNIFSIFPGFAGIRSPVRLSIFIYFFLALFVTKTYDEISRKTKHKIALSCFLVMVSLIHIVEHYPDDLYVKEARMNKFDKIACYIHQIDEDCPVLLQPIGRVGPDESILASAIRNPLINGKSGFKPFYSKNYLFPGLEEITSRRSRELLGELGVRFIVTNKEEYENHYKTSFEVFAENDYFKHIYNDNNYFIHEYIGHRNKYEPVMGDKDFLKRRCLFPINSIENKYNILLSHGRRTLHYINDKDINTYWTSNCKQGKHIKMDIIFEQRKKNSFIIIFDYKSNDYRFIDILKGFKLFAWTPNRKLTKVDYKLNIGIRNDDGIRQELFIYPRNRPIKKIRIVTQKGHKNTTYWTVNELMICDQ